MVKDLSLKEVVRILNEVWKWCVTFSTYSPLKRRSEKILEKIKILNEKSNQFLKENEELIEEIKKEYSDMLLYFVNPDKYGD